MEAALHSIVALGDDLRGLLQLHFVDYLPYFLLYCCLSILVQHVLPALQPSLYDFLLAKRLSEGKLQPSAVAAARPELASGFRTSVVASVMALHVSSVALYGLLSADTAAVLRHDFLAQTPLSRHLCLVAVAYFLWDLAFCWQDGPVFVVHGLACLAVFTGGMSPLFGRMAMVTLLFEASTPFLHARRILIDSGCTGSLWFHASNHLFGATFFATRIAHGVWACAVWWVEVDAALASGALPPRMAPLARMFQALCFLLTGLNLFWFTFKISPSYCAPSKAKAAKKVKGK
jgi:hypothetical protein